MISSLSRNLPRTTAAAASTRIRPAFSIVASTHLRRPPPPTRPAFLLPRASFASGSDSSDDDDEGKDSTTALRVDAIADIIAAEHGLKLSVSRKIVATLFDTIVEVRCIVIAERCPAHATSSRRVSPFVQNSSFVSPSFHTIQNSMGNINEQYRHIEVVGHQETDRGDHWIRQICPPRGPREGLHQPAGLQGTEDLEAPDDANQIHAAEAF
jgi:hypothetical protein